MSALVDGLDEFAAVLAAALPIRVTRDPAVAIPPCVLLDTPTVTGRTLRAFTVEVPVYLVGSGPGDKKTGDDMLVNLPDLMIAANVMESQPRPITIGEITYPAMTIVATVTIAKE
jgi:hypothetical protein